MVVQTHLDPSTSHTSTYMTPQTHPDTPNDALAPIHHERVTLANGTTLQMRVCRPPVASDDGVGSAANTTANAPPDTPTTKLLMFVHGFPEAAFVWDGLMAHFAQPANGGYTCIAPNLRGFGDSDSPNNIDAYKPKYLVDDLACLIAHYSHGPLAALVAHDWGGAVAWNLAATRPELMQRLFIINAPHPTTFLRDLRSSPAQQAASAYMNYLVREDAELRLSANDFAKLWPLFNDTQGQAPAWLTETVKQQYREVWSKGLTGGCNYYRASPLRPALAPTDAINTLVIPDALTHVNVPTTVLWGLQDRALLPGLLQGLDQHVTKLKLQTITNASHWLVHEQPRLVIENLQRLLAH